MTNFGLPTVRGMARHTARAINSLDLTGLQVRGRLDQPERKASYVEFRNWHDYGFTESEERQLMLRLEELAKIEGLRERSLGGTRTKIPALTQALIDSKAGDSEVLKKNGTVVLEGPFTLKELSSDPGDPDEGHSVMWMSDGTGSGADGDIMIKITAGGTTKTITLVDFSAV